MWRLIEPFAKTLHDLYTKSDVRLIPIFELPNPKLDEQKRYRKAKESKLREMCAKP